MSADLRLPFGHLQLEKRAHSACIESGLKSIQKVVDAVRTGELSPESVGHKTFQEIQNALYTISAVRNQHGGIDWPAFWSSRGIAESRIFLTSHALRFLSVEIRACSIGSLHLNKACSGLEAVGIKTVGNLVDAARSGMGKLKNFGAKAHEEVVQALRSLSESCREDGSVEWLKYAASRGFEIIPAQNVGSVARSFFQDLLPAACKNVVWLTVR